MKILNNKKFAEFKNNLSSQGIKKLFIVSDFDSTLISPFIEGKAVPSLMGLLRDRDLLPEEWQKKSSEMYDFYVNKAEKNKKLSFKDRIELMEEWWSKAYDLLAQNGFKYEHILKISQDLRLEYSKGVKEFLKWTSENDIPFIIMSASGLGKDCIIEFLKVRGDLTKNITVISNELIWDKNGNFINAKAPYVHSLNKNGDLIRSKEVYKEIRDKSIALLFGDDLGDATMLDGIDVEVLKVYLNIKKVKTGLEIIKHFDIEFDLDDSFIEFIQLLDLQNENKR